MPPVIRYTFLPFPVCVICSLYYFITFCSSYFLLYLPSLSAIISNPPAPHHPMRKGKQQQQTPGFSSVLPILVLMPLRLCCVWVGQKWGIILVPSIAVFCLWGGVERTSLLKLAPFSCMCFLLLNGDLEFLLNRFYQLSPIMYILLVIEYVKMIFFYNYSLTWKTK